MLAVLPDRPYPAPDTEAWLAAPRQLVDLHDVIATQEHVRLATVVTPQVRHKHLPLHVVQWRGQLYLDSGHHRAVRLILGGKPMVRALVLDLGVAE